MLKLNPLGIINNLGDMAYNLTVSLKNFRNGKDFPVQMGLIFLILAVLYLTGLWFLVFYFKVV